MTLKLQAFGPQHRHAMIGPRCLRFLQDIRGSLCLYTLLAVEWTTVSNQLKSIPEARPPSDLKRASKWRRRSSSR